MHIVARRIIFYLFVAAFLIGAPFIVLYTAGYRYSLESGTFVRTGVLSVNSVPRNVSLFIDGVDLDRTTPHVVKYILPGSYDVHLEREGYHAWTGTVDIYSGETTYLQDVLLFQNAPPELVLETPVDFLTPSPNNTTVAYQVDAQGWSEVWLYELDSGLQRLIDRFVSTPTETVYLAWSAEGGYLLAENSLAHAFQVYKGDGQMVTVDETALEDVQTAFWHPSNDNVLYLATEEELREYDLQSNVLKRYDNADVASVLIDASLLVFVDNGTQIELRQVINDEYTVLALLPQASYRVVKRDGSFVLILDENNTLFLVDIHAQRPILLQTTVTHYDWHAQNDELLYTDGYEINTYNPHSHTFRFVTRQGVPIDDVVWHAGGEMLLVSTNGSLLAIEKQKRADERVVTTLISGADIERLWTSRDGRFVYFYGTVDNVRGLHQLPLMR